MFFSFPASKNLQTVFKIWGKISVPMRESGIATDSCAVVHRTLYPCWVVILLPLSIHTSFSSQKSLLFSSLVQYRLSRDFANSNVDCQFNWSHTVDCFFLVPSAFRDLRCNLFDGMKLFAPAPENLLGKLAWVFFEGKCSESRSFCVVCVGSCTHRLEFKLCLWSPFWDCETIS